MLRRFRSHSGEWDLAVIGGGATGVGIAVDAASRGYSTLLLEAHDFGKGTSSRSTKLVHGGVRYLEQGNLSLVMHALKERGILRQNAPHLVNELGLVVPSYRWWETPFFGTGLKVYNLLSGRYSFGRSRILSRKETVKLLPSINRAGLRSGVIYYDGQFDDARLLINLVSTGAEQGATLLNYCPVTRLNRNVAGKVSGVVGCNLETGDELFASAKVVINATGPFTDGVRKMADPTVSNIISPSQGVHLVFDRTFLPGDCALMVPHVGDGRVMFAIPWLGHTLLGTTDTGIPKPEIEPFPKEQEIESLLDTARKYLSPAPKREDVLSVFTGIRPLVKNSDASNTAALSRDHTIHIDGSGLVTITGGKWTTYREMAEDCVNRAASLAGLPQRPCVTRELRIHGFQQLSTENDHLSSYGSDASAIRNVMASSAELAAPLSPALRYTAAEVVWAVRYEMARTVEDVLCRRTRSLFLNARAALHAAPRVARLMAAELGKEPEWQTQQLKMFSETAAHFLLS
jgi:glycerol-3-phosphate dehydrogenase